MASRKGVTVGELARAVGGALEGEASAPAFDVTHDSRQARPGWVFVAIRGEKFDGNRFAFDVSEKGAAAVMSETERPAGFGGAWIRVGDARLALAYAAAEVHGHPSRGLKLVGITGTNGKTTTAYLVSAIAEGAGLRDALVSTVEYRVAGESLPAPHTTPEASDLQRLLRRAVERDCGVAVMEASSQALDLRRCDALKFSVAAFTNLTRDHLDYHGTMENYFLSKRRLFDGSLGEPPVVSVINADDGYGARLAEEVRAEGRRVVSYGIEREADVTAREVEAALDGTEFLLVTPSGEIGIRSPLVGRAHVYNLLTATACALELGVPLEEIARALRDCGGAPGRFERVRHDAGEFAVVVDYAHTDDALKNVLLTARRVAGGRVITVFGCGGDRDRTKRAPMGEVAALMSDVVIATSDNPRTEDPEAILADIEPGLRKAGKPYLKIVDRREAIHRAIEEAAADDLVLIAGKGHEDYQIIGTERHHFDDREVAREALAARAEKRGDA